jgi:N-glycosylase/DNA lyase
VQEQAFPVRDYALGETLGSGQAFRWRPAPGSAAWEGVIGARWVRLTPGRDSIVAAVAAPASDWSWLEDYLQLKAELAPILASFPSDPHLAAAVEACRGLRLLRQDPWECLASFILSSTKQIVQIQQIVALICERFGERVAGPDERAPVFAFPRQERIAALDEEELRCCKMGFRAPYLRRTAQMVAGGEIDLEGIRELPVEAARGELMRCPGVGRKIADCVLLFAFGFQQAFPIDVWILRALKELYFARKRPTPARLLHFTQTYFGPNAGYAQQYLFHYIRTRLNS